MSEQKTPLRYRWRDRVKSADGPDDHVLRLVLAFLGDWSPKDGGPFSVSVRKLCEQTALGDSAVRERLAQARGIWFTEQRRPGLTSVYRLRIPTAIESERTLEEVRRRPSGYWETVENSGDPTARAVDPEEETLPPGRETPTARAVDHPTARAALRRKRHTPDVARPRARSVENLAAAAPGDSGGGSDPSDSDQEEPAAEEGDHQLPLARLVLQAVQGGDEDAFDEACEKIRQERREAREAKG